MERGLRLILLVFLADMARPGLCLGGGTRATDREEDVLPTEKEKAWNAAPDVRDLYHRDDHFLTAPWSCTANYNTPKTCTIVKGCEWCRGDGLPGICVTTFQAEILIHKIPHVNCFGNDDDDNDNDDLGVVEWVSTATTDQEEGPLLQDPLDPYCLNAPGDATNDDDDGTDPVELCESTSDMEGEPCVWCNGAGVFGLCLKWEQAEKAANYLDCDLFVF